MFSHVIRTRFCSQSMLSCPHSRLGLLQPATSKLLLQHTGQRSQVVSFTASSLSQRRQVLAKAGRRTSSIPEEDDELDLPPETTVRPEKKDFSIGELASKFKDGELNLQPSYQRGLVWTMKMTSRLVVTALEGRIVPTVYLEEDEDGNYSVMDGKQRLASLITFYLGDANLGGFEWREAPISLHVIDDTTCDHRWHGVTYDKLPERRKKQFKNYSLMCVIINSSTDRDVVFNIYQDINTGSVSHTEQQSRKAAFHGPYIDLLDRLASNTHFVKIQGRSEPDSRKEEDRELALRFFAMRRSAKLFKTPMMRFLNQEVKAHQNAKEEELRSLQDAFKLTTDVVWQIWGERTCRDARVGAQSKQPPALNPSLWDAIMVAVCEEIESGHKPRRKELTSNADKILKGYEKLLQNADFRKSMVSTSKANVARRIELMWQMLREAAPTRFDAKRAFRPSDKQQLWDAAVASNGRTVQCGLCNQAIHTLDDAEVDHILPWSHGGQTDLSNAQLVHRFCNRNKGNRVSSQPLEQPHEQRQQ